MSPSGEEANMDKVIDRGTDTDNEEKHINDNLDHVESFFGAFDNANKSKLSQATLRRLAELQKQVARLDISTQKNENKPEIKKNKVDTESEHPSDTESTDSDSTEKETSSSDDKSTPRSAPAQACKVTRKKKRKSSTTRILEKLVDRLDNRPYMELDAFDEKSGETLKEYVIRFEDHCRKNTRGDSKLQIKLLEEKLSGQTLKAFRSFKTKTDRFEDTKRKLLQWYSDMKEMRHEKSKSKFQNMTYESHDSLFIYSNALEQQFKLAYPNKDVQTNKTLRKKFTESMPEEFKKELLIHTRAKALENKTTTWDEVQRLTRMKDIEIMQNKEVKSEKIIINIQEESGRRRSSNPSGYSNNSHQQRRNEWSNNSYSNNHRPGVANNRTNNNYSNNYGSGDTNNRNSNRNYQSPSGFNKNGNSNYRQRFNNTANNTPIGVRPRYPYRPATRPNFTMLYCTHCQRMGHVQENCRIFNKQCLTCGKEGHDRQACHFNQQNRMDGASGNEQREVHNNSRGLNTNNNNSSN